MISEKLQRFKYIAADFVATNIAWFAFDCVRYSMHVVKGDYTSLQDFLLSSNVLVGQLLLPLLMLFVFSLSGYYNEVFRKSRLHELFTTAWSAMANTLLIFFVALINDVSHVRATDYLIIIILFAILFTVVYAFRFFITANASHCIKHRLWSFPTLIVGSGPEARAFADKLNSMKSALGYDIKGFVNIPEETPTCDDCIKLDSIEDVCRAQGIKELVVVPSTRDENTLLHTINKLYKLGLPIKVQPVHLGGLPFKMRISDMVGDPLVDISSSNLGECGKNLKRFMDIVISLLALILLSPLYLIIGLMVKFDSQGPVFYLQDRVGLHNKPFRIIKFRTMVSDAEVDGQPRLTQDDDPRITRIGRFMRKYRIDELPQFLNVLLGDMSIVGPRPERRFFIDQITQREPSYALLHRVRPGITSLGMVKYGYAQNIDQMVERLQYDLLYLENMSLLNDCKILVYTVKIVFTGRGM